MIKKYFKKALGLFLAITVILSSLPFVAMPAAAESAEIVADPGTAHTFESIMGTDIDGNRYAGRVWVDKSVYTDGQTAILNTSGDEGSTFKVNLEAGENFQTVFSALGSSMTTTTTNSSTGPMDVVLILDDSTSMDDVSAGTTRLEKLIKASNKLLENLLKVPNIRIGIVAYNYDDIEILPFGRYENGIELSVLNNKYYFDEYNSGDKGGTIRAFDNSGRLLHNNTKGYQRGTNLQYGFDAGMRMLESASDTTGRAPVAIVLTDGSANTAAQQSFYNIANQTPRSIFNGSVAQSIALATLLNAAYRKASVEDVYGKAPTIYGIGVDLGNDAAANAVINPGATQNGFNSSNSNADIRGAYNLYRNTWLRGNTVTRTENYMGNHSFSFDHNYPAGSKVTDADIENNINYVDTYYDVSSAQLEETFKVIYEELSSGVFNPITSTVTVDGATGVKDTPLIYVDHIGKYMEVKNIQAVTLFGSSYNVIKNADGTYVVAKAIGINPTTNENYDTSEDIKIVVTENKDGTQKLEIKINQEILPIVLEQVVSKTVGDETNATINEFSYNPLRVFYTVGMDSDILLPNGDVDITKIDSGYEYIDDAKGEITLYSNQFGVAADEFDDEGNPLPRKAHVGFKPSAKNRYYYHQANQGIFTKIKDKENNNQEVTIPENQEYGIIWDDDKYDLDWMTYGEYLSTADDDLVYTYVTYYHPTPSTSDAANVAEKVTYLVYTDWKFLKESVAFYDAKTEKYVNYDDAKGYTLDDIGYTMTDKQIEDYLKQNPSAEIYAVLGVGSHRTSRFHNMTFDKSQNLTETNPIRYAPEYTEGMAKNHHDNDVVVWLGNNGKLTVPVATGIALTKSVTEAIGNADDTYALTVTVPAGTIANPVVKDLNGNDVTSATSSYVNNVLTVNVKAGETVYVSGIPAGTTVTVGESIPNGAEYSMVSAEQSVTIPTLSQAINGTAAQFVSVTVTNRPHKYGNLYITKELESDHAIPEKIMSEVFAFNINGGSALANKTFDVTDSKNVLKTITFDANGLATVRISPRQTMEILNLPENIQVEITEILTNAQKEIFTGVEYRARNHSGEQATETTDKATVIIPADANATAVVINTYEPRSTTVDLDVLVNKNFASEEVKDKLSGGTFSFKVQKYDDVNQKWNDIATDSISYSAQEYGKKSITIADVLKNEVFKNTGTYAYQVIEVIGSVTNISYDRTIYTFDVVVTDNDGQLVATVIDLRGNEIKNTVDDSALDYTVDFNNTYETAPISMDIEKALNNLSGDDEISAAGFKFRSIETDANGNPKAPLVTNIISSDAAGEARMSGAYTKDKIGTHYYVVSEVDEGKPGWTYSKAEYLVTVTVSDTDPGTGVKLVAVMEIAPHNDAAKAETAPTVTDNNKGKLYFTNTYNPDDVTISVDALVKKKLEGKDLNADDFTFEVYENGKSNAILRGTNDANGNIAFKAVDANALLTKNNILNFSKAGKYEFDIKEVIPLAANYDAATDKYTLNGITYDQRIFDLVVEVDDNPETGKLEVNYYFEDATTKVVTFNNYYNVAPTEYTISGLKTLTGRAMGNGEFAFELYEGNTLTQTVKNKIDGTFTFSAINYTAAGEHIYTVKEVLPAGTDANGKNSANGVTYDLKEYVITVTVTDNGDGTLTASADVKNADIKFENSYKAAPATVKFSGNKVYKGANIAADLFSFKLYETEHHLDITAADTKVLDTKQNDADGKFAFGEITYTTPGTRFYVIAEDSTYNPIEKVVYDTTQHTFRVQVRDNGAGQLTVVVTDLDASTSSSSATSAAAEVTFTNATFDEATEKEVAKQQNAVAKIDGELVSAGEILTYYIYYYNYTGKEATVEISDTIPAHTSYVEGSASHNGKYAGRNIDWILTVPKAGSVMVQFSVKVDDDNAIVANTAIVRDGTNTYTTNTVNNHTYKDPVSKDVFAPDDVDLSIDGEKVYSGDTLIYEITYTNTSYNTVDVTITDSIPANTTYVANSADNGGAYSGGKLTWNLTDVQPWTTVTVAFMVTVDDNIGAVTIPNKAEVKVGNNTYETNVVTNHTVLDEVDKKVYFENTTVNVDGKKVYAGDTLVYEISYKNTDTKEATVTITDSIPQHTEYVANSADNGGVYDNGKIIWNLTVGAGETAKVTFKVKVDSNIATSEIAKIAKILEGKNEYTTKTVTNYTTQDEVNKLVLSPENLNINIDGKKVYEGDTLIYKINYKNTDTKADATVTITDTIPAYTTYQDGSADNNGVYNDGKITWNITVPAGETESVTFKVTVNSNIGAVEIPNSATAVEGRNIYKTNEVKNHTVLDEVEKQVFFEADTTVNIDGEKVYSGDVLVYSVDYKNTSNEDATVVIKDTIPEYTTYVEGSADNNGTYADGKLTWNLTVPAGETESVTFKVTVDSDIGAVEITNTAEIKEGRNTYETNKTVNTTTEDEVNKDVFNAEVPTVSIDGQKISAGDTLIYEITYKNNYSEEAAVTITDAIPEYTTYVEDSADNGGVYADGKLNWNLKVGAGESITVSFKVTVGDAEGVDITNTATVLEGRNTYTTNEVVTPTNVEPPVVPENPPVPNTPDEPPTPDNPETGDNSNFALLLALAFISGGIFAGTMLFGRKRKAN